MNITNSPAALRALLAEEGIHDERVLGAIERTPRDRFIPEESRDLAWANIALPIGAGQTISQPYIVAVMTEALELAGDETVLEIGTGSGYQAAILSQLCARVVTIERFEELSSAAHETLDRLGYRNIEYGIGDGTLGYPERSPFDGILVTAAAPRIPEPLYEQLRPGGRIIIPVGDESTQSLQAVTKPAGGGPPRIRVLCGCRFVKLIGAAGWQPA